MMKTKPRILVAAATVALSIGIIGVPTLADARGGGGGHRGGGHGGGGHGGGGHGGFGGGHGFGGRGFGGRGYGRGFGGRSYGYGGGYYGGYRCGPIRLAAGLCGGYGYY